MNVEPLVGAFGFELSGCDVTAFSDREVAEFTHRLNDAGLIVCRDQSLTPSSLSAFAARLGERGVYPFAQALDEDPFVVPVVKEAADEFNFGGTWHTDTSYLELPPSFTLLHAVALPASGGDTLYADARAAFEALSPTLRSILEPLVGIYTSSLVHEAQGAFASVAGADRNRLTPEDIPSCVEHPIIRTHPVTGKKAIFSSLGHTERIKGMSCNESRALLEFLAAQTTRAEFCTRLRWRPGTLALWDNRSVQHFPLNDYPGQHREMHRVILKGERPQ
jgi:taurine dioxygenase